jgi:hypothetical protein
MIGSIADLLYYLTDCLITGAVCFWWLVGGAVPHPTWPDLIKGCVTFVALYPIRIVMKVALPEDKVYRRGKKRSVAVPSQAEHQGAAAIISSIHH